MASDESCSDPVDPPALHLSNVTRSVQSDSCQSSSAECVSNSNSAVKLVKESSDNQTLSNGTDDSLSQNQLQQAQETESEPGNATLMLSYLDEMEDRIEAFRRQAHALVEEKQSLLAILSGMHGDCDQHLHENSSDLLPHIERLKQHCEAVEICVLTVRSAEQQACIARADELVAALEHQCFYEEPNDDPSKGYQAKAKSYLNACQSDGCSGPIDYRFQGLVLGCKLEDQKSLKQRLQSLAEGHCPIDFLPRDLSDPSDPIGEPADLQQSQGPD